MMDKDFSTAIMLVKDQEEEVPTILADLAPEVILPISVEKPPSPVGQFSPPLSPSIPSSSGVPEGITVSSPPIDPLLNLPTMTSSSEIQEVFEILLDLGDQWVSPMKIGVSSSLGGDSLAQRLFDKYEKTIKDIYEIASMYLKLQALLDKISMQADIIVGKRKLLKEGLVHIKISYERVKNIKVPGSQQTFAKKLMVIYQSELLIKEIEKMEADVEFLLADVKKDWSSAGLGGVKDMISENIGNKLQAYKDEVAKCEQDKDSFWVKVPQIYEHLVHMKEINNNYEKRLREMSTEVNVLFYALKTVP